MAPDNTLCLQSMHTELLVHLLEDPLGRLTLGRESKASSELAALGDELVLDVNLDLVQFLLQLLLCRWGLHSEEHRFLCENELHFIEGITIENVPRTSPRIHRRCSAQVLVRAGVERRGEFA